MHKSHSPTSPMRIPIQIFPEGLLPRKIENTGTMTIYNAVMKLARAVVVYAMPICWTTLAANRATPQMMPPRRSLGANMVLLSVLMRLRSMHTITGSKNTTAIQFRRAINVDAPTYSAPTLWDTNAKPQIIAARMRRRVCVTAVFLFFIICFSW